MADTSSRGPAASGAVYFPGLDSLRFFAAFPVWFTHALVITGYLGFERVVAPGVLHSETGKLGVFLFFVLSGFLITYLLLTEQERTHTVSVWRFYVRRALRIWPIYYLMVLCAFFFFPPLLSGVVPRIPQYLEGDYSSKLLLYMLLLPNLTGPVYFVGHFWSIGAEEQFYLIWPWLARRARWVYLACTAVIVLQIGLLSWSMTLPASSPWSFLRLLLLSSRFDCMAIGAIFAVFLKRQSRPALWLLLRNTTLLLALLLLARLYLTGFHLPVVGPTVWGFLFAVVILNVAANPRSFLKLRWRWTSYLGRISYGLYVYHPFAIVMTAKAVAAFFDPASVPFAGSLALTLATGLVSVGISALSYRYYEAPVLGLKKRFTRVASGAATLGG